MTKAELRDAADLLRAILARVEAGELKRSALDACRSGEVGGVVVAKLDRLSRSIVDFGHLLEVEFPRFGGHLLTECVSVGKDVCYAEDAVVLVGVPFGGCEAVAEQRSFGPEARS
jgi:hypothetical protein